MTLPTKKTMNFHLPKGKDITNLAALGIIQAANAILPLTVFPFVLHIVGIERFANIVWTESVALISLGFVLYSFDIDGVRRLISIGTYPNDERLKNLFYAIFWSRLIILSAVSMLILPVIFLLNREIFTLQLSWLLYVLGHIFQSFWFFQATEKNVFVAISTALLRLTCAIFIYILIDDKESYIYVPMLIGGSYLFSGIIAFLYANFIFKMNPKFSSRSEIINLLSNGRHIFFGNISVILFRGLNVILLKAFSVDSAVSAYSIAEKIVKCAQAAIRPLNQFSYPKIVSEINNSSFLSSNSIRMISRYTFPQLLTLLILFIIAFIVYFLAISVGFKLTEVDNEIFILLGIMLFAPFFGICNFMFGTAGLNALGLDRCYARAIFYTGVLSFILSLILIILFDAVGASVSFVLGEALLFYFIMNILVNYKQNSHQPFPN